MPRAWTLGRGAGLPTLVRSQAQSGAFLWDALGDTMVPDMGLFGPSIPSLAEPEEEHVIALCKALGVPGPAAYNLFQNALSAFERIFIWKELAPKYGVQAGPRFVKSYREDALLRGSPISDAAFEKLNEVSNTSDFTTAVHGIRFQILGDIWREWFGSTSDADNWYRPFMKEYIKQQKS